MPREWLFSEHKSILNIYSNRAAAYDIICLEAVVLPGGKTMEHLYGNGRKFASFLLISSVFIIEHLQY